MNIEEYVFNRLETGERLEDVLNEIAAAGNSASKKYCARTAAKDYTKPVGLDNDLLVHIRDNAITPNDISDMILYMVFANMPEDVNYNKEIFIAMKKIKEEALNAIVEDCESIVKTILAIASSINSNEELAEGIQLFIDSFKLLR